jgi:DNA-binding NarL/FixJ family response regulator
MRTNGQGPGAPGRLDVLLVIFDFPTLVAGFRTIIDGEADMRVAGVMDDPGALRDRLDQVPADVVITECLPVSDAGGSAYETIEAIRAARPAARILALECRTGGDHYTQALKAGADGYLTREAEAEDLVAAIRCVARGETYVSPSIVTAMVNTYVLRTPGATVEDAYESLTERERQILLLAAVGHTNREIARTFQLSEQTIHHHRATMMEKLGFHGRGELLRFALRRGIIKAADL